MSCQRNIPMRAIIRHTISLRDQPPMPCLTLKAKMRIDWRVDVPANHIATELCWAKSEAVVRAVIRRSMNRVVLWGFASPFRIALA